MLSFAAEIAARDVFLILAQECPPVIIDAAFVELGTTVWRVGRIVRAYIVQLCERWRIDEAQDASTM